MENAKVLIDNIKKDVYGLFYIYDSKYYFIYTEKEVDENDYVVLYMTQVGKETINTQNGPIDTGYMIGVEITNPEDQQKAQTSISYIVEDKKNNTVNPQIQYLPMNMLNNLKIVSKKRFRLLKSIMINNFKLEFETEVNTVSDIASQIGDVIPSSIESVVPQPIIPIADQTVDTSTDSQLRPLTEINNDTAVTEVDQPSKEDSINNNISGNTEIGDSNVIVDYRTKYFEQEEKNKELEAQIEILTQKLNEIKKVIE